jgi:signal transduction histidine kinase/CheY-like chemotaxis protein
MRNKRRSSHYATLVGTLLVVTILVSLGLATWVEYKQTIAQWNRQLTNLSLILAETSTQEVTSAELVLNSIIDGIYAADVRSTGDLRRKMQGFSVHASMRDKIRALPQVDVATIVDAKGDIVNFTRAHPVLPINLADRDYFQQHLAQPSLGMLISRPVHDTGTGDWTFYLSRRLNGPKGEFLGVVLVGLSSSFFTDFFSKISLGRASISLYRRDFSLLARYPEAEDKMGKINKDGNTYKIIEEMKMKAGVLLSDSPRQAQGGQQVARMGAARVLEKYPLIVNVTVTDDLYLGRWRQFAAYISIVAGCSAAAIAIAFVLLVKAFGRRERDLELAERLMGEAEAASRAKSEFLTMMSHEIRTPLTSIIGFAELLGSSTGSAAREDAGDVILRNGRHLLSIINDILDISKIEAGRLQIERVAFSPLDIVIGLDTVMEPHASSKGISFKVVYAFPLPAQVMGDPTRWKQILFNLCSNAIKFTELGSVRLTLWYDRVDERLVCNVVDTGIGISNEQINLLFKPFTQADNAISRRFGGSGLGLHLVQKLAERMDGKVTVVSELGQGSIFEVEIIAPLADDAMWLHQAPAVSGLAPASAASVATSLKGRVLLAEDGPDNQKLLTAYFHRIGLDFKIVDNGAQAVEEALAGDYDIVLMDMQMPVMDGATATSVLRAAGYTGPIVALTANVMAEDVQRYMAAGCSHCVGKPIDFAVLTEVLASSLNQHAAPLPVLTAEQMHEFDTIRTAFAQSLPERLMLLNNAIHGRDWDELGRLAHSLKGTAGSFGYHGVTHAARELEQAAKHGDMAMALTLVQQITQRAQSPAHLQT